MASAILRQTRSSALQSMFDSLRNGGSFMSHAKLAVGTDIVSAAPDVSLQKARNWDEGVSSIFSTTPLNEILKGNQAVIFGLPGAFTGVCSKQHVPSYKNNIDKFKAIGIDSVAGNQRHKSSLVGTSAATRTTTYPKSFCEWLAGILDGDGSIQVSKQGYTSLEITMGLEDLRLLRYIQNMLGGSIKMRSGAKAFRYRLHNQLGMIKLMNCINGHIRDSARLLQLHRVCQVLDIPVILPITPDAQSNWFAGFFDADGTIGIAMKNRLPQLCIGVTNQHLQDVESYKAVFGGNIYFDSSRNGYYQWSVQSRKDVIMMLDYFKSSTFRSHKSQRFFLIEEFYSLYDLKAFEPDSIHHKAWLAFLDKWNRLIHCQPAFSSWKDQMKQEIGLDERERELLLEER